MRTLFVHLLLLYHRWLDDHKHLQTAWLYRRGEAIWKYIYNLYFLQSGNCHNTLFSLLVRAHTPGASVVHMMVLEVLQLPSSRGREEGGGEVARLLPAPWPLPARNNKSHKISEDLKTPDNRAFHI